MSLAILRLIQSVKQKRDKRQNLICAKVPNGGGGQRHVSVHTDSAICLGLDWTGRCPLLVPFICIFHRWPSHSLPLFDQITLSIIVIHFTRSSTNPISEESPFVRLFQGNKRPSRARLFSTNPRAVGRRMPKAYVRSEYDGDSCDAKSAFSEPHVLPDESTAMCGARLGEDLSQVHPP